MKKLNLLFFAAFLLIMLEVQSQSLVNGLETSDVYIEMDGKKQISVPASGKMVLQYTPATIKLYQDDQYTYWAEFTFRQCGKKARLKSKTYLELKNGEIIQGQSLSQRKNLAKGEDDWMAGIFEDSFKPDKNNEKQLNAGFRYAMRFAN